MSSHVTRLENLLEAVPEALVGVDQSGMIRFINHQTESLFGYDRGNLIDRPIDTLVPEDVGGSTRRIERAISPILRPGPWGSI